MRLIDANALKEKMRRTNRYFDVKFDIDEAPTIDAEPVRHGHWIYDQHRWICSECHENPTFGMGYVQSERSLYNYCPLCGAKMDEVSE